MFLKTRLRFLGQARQIIDQSFHFIIVYGCAVRGSHLHDFGTPVISTQWRLPQHHSSGMTNQAMTGGRLRALARWKALVAWRQLNAHVDPSPGLRRVVIRGGRRDGRPRAPKSAHDERHGCDPQQREKPSNPLSSGHPLSLHYTELTTTDSMTLRMNPPPFQLARSGWVAPATLTALTIRTCRPRVRGRNDTSQVRKLYLPWSGPN